MGNTQTLPALLELPAGGGPPPSKASSPCVQTLLHTRKYPGHQMQCLLAPACHSPHLLPIINPSHRDSPLLFQQERLRCPAGPLHSLFPLPEPVFLQTSNNTDFFPHSTLCLNLSKRGCSRATQTETMAPILALFITAALTTFPVHSIIWYYRLY